MHIHHIIGLVSYVVEIPLSDIVDQYCVVVGKYYYRDVIPTTKTSPTSCTYHCFISCIYTHMYREFFKNFCTSIIALVSQLRLTNAKVKASSILLSLLTYMLAETLACMTA